MLTYLLAFILVAHSYKSPNALLHLKMRSLPFPVHNPSTVINAHARTHSPHLSTGRLTWYGFWQWKRQTPSTALHLLRPYKPQGSSCKSFKTWIRFPFQHFCSCYSSLSLQGPLPSFKLPHKGFFCRDQSVRRPLPQVTDCRLPWLYFSSCGTYCCVVLHGTIYNPVLGCLRGRELCRLCLLFYL